MAYALHWLNLCMLLSVHQSKQETIATTWPGAIINSFWILTNLIYFSLYLIFASRYNSVIFFDIYVYFLNFFLILVRCSTYHSTKQVSIFFSYIEAIAFLISIYWKGLSPPKFDTRKFILVLKCWSEFTRFPTTSSATWTFFIIFFCYLASYVRYVNFFLRYVLKCDHAQFDVRAVTLKASTLLCQTKALAYKFSGRFCRDPTSTEWNSKEQVQPIFHVRSRQTEPTRLTGLRSSIL